MREAALAHETDFAGWRARTRDLLAAGAGIDEVVWRVGEARDLLGLAADSSLPSPAPETPAAGAAAPAGELRVSRRLVELAETVIRHREPARLALLWRLVWRSAHGEPRLIDVASDPELARARAMAAAVRRDIHKMQAFVRFREIPRTGSAAEPIRVGDDGGEAAGEPRKEGGAAGAPVFVAWFEPAHRIVEAAAPFFVRRFASMRWSILTPDRCAHWDGRELRFSPGASRADAPSGDALDALWRRYYAGIFDPARLNPEAMRAQMPVRYWANLPEARLIRPLVREAGTRTASMLTPAAAAGMLAPAAAAGMLSPAAAATAISAPPPAPARPRHLPKHPGRLGPPGAAIDPGVLRGSPPAGPPRTCCSSSVPEAPGSRDAPETLASLRRELRGCRACPRWEPATQAVCGEGPADARLVLVGEQPGDQEDLAGRPFVGPAGALLDRALSEAGIDRARTYVTNAVKHFKFTLRGKRRIHQKPDAGEIEACRWWLDRELDMIRPQVVVLLGVTAARAVLRRDVAITRERGRSLPLNTAGDADAYGETHEGRGACEGPGVREGRHVRVVPTFHPSYLLRLPDAAAKDAAWRLFVADLTLAASLVSET